MTTALATLAAFAMLLGACCLPGEYCGDLEISIFNETAESVVVFGVGESGEEAHVIDLLPGQGLPVRNILDQESHCTDADLIARTDAGDIVAVYEEQLCNGDTWVITETDGPASSQVDLVGLVGANSTSETCWDAAR